MLFFVLRNICLFCHFFLFVTCQVLRPIVPIKCGQNSHCPIEYPCCSPYGDCGKGAICVGGCNPKFSFQETSCLPMPIIAHPYGIKFDYLQKKIGKRDTRLRQPFGIDSQITIKDLNDKRLLERGFIHYTDYLINNNVTTIKKMFNDYDFTYSGMTEFENHNTGGLVLKMPKNTRGALIASTREFLYGRTKVTLKSSPGQGVITAIVLISQVGDEIDLEFLGNHVNTVESNFYFQGELDYTKMQLLNTNKDNTKNFHTYEIDWNPERIQWFIDGELKRTLLKRETWDPTLNIYKYPQTPVRLEIALWPGGVADSPPGTVDWAGGPIDWNNDPEIKGKGFFSTHIRSIIIDPVQNPYMTEIMKCLRMKKSKRDITVKDLTGVTVKYNPMLDSLFTEKSLEWCCDTIYYIENSTNNQKRELRLSEEDKTKVKVKSQNYTSRQEVNSTITNINSVHHSETNVATPRGQNRDSSSNSNSIQSRNIIRRLVKVIKRASPLCCSLRI